ncbi:MAG: hypothetical protein ACKPKO_14760, partial [Candidatus Fonsibacter sp.]
MTATYQGKSADMLLSVEKLRAVEQQARSQTVGLAQRASVAIAAYSSSAAPSPMAEEKARTTRDINIIGRIMEYGSAQLVS